MSETLEHHPSEKELALSAHTRRQAFHRDIEAKAAALLVPRPVVIPPAKPAALEAATPATAWFKECWFMIEGVSPNAKLTIRQIKRAVCDHYSVKVEDVDSHRRTKDIIPARQVAMFLCKELTPGTLPAIGRAFGDRDHTTVLHACRKIAALVKENAPMRADVAKIRAGLESLL